MRRVLVYSLLLIAGLVASQVIPASGGAVLPVRFATMAALSFIMIQVGREFTLDKNNPRQYGWDYLVAFTAASFPWILCAIYFVFVMSPQGLWGHPDLWKETLLTARFASPTSAGVLFAMLAAAGLAGTWLFHKARVLAILDDLDTILLMIPLQIILVGLQWQMGVVLTAIVIMLWAGWRYLHLVPIPSSWPWILTYSAIVAGASELVYAGSKVVDPNAPVHLEVLLPAFVLGCIMANPRHETGRRADMEKRVATIVSACFMVLVGLSMPVIRTGTEATAEPVAVSPTQFEGETGGKDNVLAYAGADPQLMQQKERFPGWTMIALHVLAITVLANLGKMFPAFCYRRHATMRQRLALAIGMWPRGEVGAGVLVISISYGLGGPVLTVASLSLTLNLLLTGAVIVCVRKLLEEKQSLDEMRAGALA